MKRFPSSDNLDALISLCPPKEKKKLKNDYAYSKKFQTMLDNLDEEDCLVESREATEKKRRLSLEQVKALEKSFNVENKLEPERKLKLAKELGLQPRQVAIWFQNRRARCKAKQLEKEYGILKANYDSLKLKFDNLAQEKSALTKELKKVKAKLCGDNAADSSHVKEESLESIHNTSEESKNVDKCENGKQAGTSLGSSLEDRLSHDNSSEVLVDDQLMPSQIDYSTFVNINGPCSMVNWFEIPESKVIQPRLYQNQFVKVEDQTLFSVDESCNIFSVDQAPTLHWYLPQC